MQANVLLTAVFLTTLFLGGCMGVGTGNADADKPKTHEYNLVVHQGLSDTIQLYEKNDGNYSKAVAITFQDVDTSQSAPQTLPGPQIGGSDDPVYEGDTVVIHLQNLNGLEHTLHLHGGLIPWDQDGVDFLTQNPIMPGGEFTYTFTALKAGTYWYHCHFDGAHHIDFGMYGALIVEERHPAIHYDRQYVVFLDEYDNCHVHGNTDPVATVNTQYTPAAVGSNQEMTPDFQSQTECYYRFLLDNMAQNAALTTTGQTVGGTVPQPAKDTLCPEIQQLPDSPADAKAAKEDLLTASGCNGAHSHGTPPPQQEAKVWWPETHPVYNPLYNTFLVNGKAFPDSPVFPVKEGETVLFRLINAGNLVHTWHLHGHTMLVTHKDGYPLAGGPQAQDTISIAPGERFDFIVHANNPGLWMVHDQMGQYTENDNVHPGGMMACMAYDGFHDAPAFNFTRALDCNNYAIQHILGEHHHTG